jgi:hypothetical protein
MEKISYNYKTAKKGKEMSGAKEIIEAYNQIQGLVAVLLGLLLQYFLGDKKGIRIAIVITSSTLFVALFIAPAIIETVSMLVDIQPTGKIAISIYALSSLMSVELLAILITILPSAIGTKIKKMMGVENDSK